VVQPVLEPTVAAVQRQQPPGAGPPEGVAGDPESHFDDVLALLPGPRKGEGPNHVRGQFAAEVDYAQEAALPGEYRQGQEREDGQQGVLLELGTSRVGGSAPAVRRTPA
jgi:hypothetical protein